MKTFCSLEQSSDTGLGMVQQNWLPPPPVQAFQDVQQSLFSTA
jgi:hypothetical protein